MNRQPDDEELQALTRAALDESVENLDAATLSKLNQARQEAVQATQRTSFLRLLPVAAAAFGLLAVAVALPLLTGSPQGEGDIALIDKTTSITDATTVSESDSAVIEDLDLMLFLIDAEDHAS